MKKKPRKRTPAPPARPYVSLRYVHIEAILKSLRRDEAVVRAILAGLEPKIRKFKTERLDARLLEAYHEPVACLAIEMPRAIQSLVYIGSQLYELEHLVKAIAKEIARQRAAKVDAPIQEAPGGRLRIKAGATVRHR